MFVSRVHTCVAGLALGLLIAGGSSHAEAQRCEVAGISKLTPAEPVPHDDFGGSVCISGDVALIGACWDSEAATHSGAAYVFRFNGQSWSEEAKLYPDDVMAHAGFGASLSVSGDVALIGTNSGGAYVFRFDGNDWREEAKLDVASGGFGHSVAVDGDVAVVGAYGDDGAGDDAGAVYVFCFDGNGWLEQARLAPADVAEGDWFGFSVGVSGSAIVVGSRHHGGAGNNAGAAYVFRRDGAAWREEAKLAASGGGVGFSVSIDGNVTVIGAPWSNAAYVYRYDGSGWPLDAELTAADGAAEDHLGWSVSVSGDVVVAGVIAWDQEGAYYQRPAIVFHYDGGAWAEQARLSPSESTWAAFGWSVCVSDPLAVIGEPSDSYYGTPYGTAYEFRGLSDCNANGRLDLCDIVSGASVDADADGVPDECETSAEDDGTSGSDQAGDETDSDEDDTPGSEPSNSEGEDPTDEPEIPLSCCGPGACGPGSLGWLPASLLGLGCIKSCMRQPKRLARHKHNEPKPHDRCER